MDLVMIVCTLAGIFIAGLVQMFKGWTFVNRHPKIVAAVLAAITAVVSGLTIGSLDWRAIAECVIVPFTTAVATYEVAKSTTKTV